MVIRSKLEHEIEHQARPVDSAHVCSHSGHKNVIKSMKQPTYFTSKRCTMSVNRGNKEPIILLFHIWESNLEPSLQLLIGIRNNGFVRVNIASQLNMLHNHFGLFEEIYCQIYQHAKYINSSTVKSPADGI